MSADGRLVGREVGDRRTEQEEGQVVGGRAGKNWGGDTRRMEGELMCTENSDDNRTNRKGASSTSQTPRSQLENSIFKNSILTGAEEMARQLSLLFRELRLKFRHPCRAS